MLVFDSKKSATCGICGIVVSRRDNLPSHFKHVHPGVAPIESMAGQKKLKH